MNAPHVRHMMRRRIVRRSPLGWTVLLSGLAGYLGLLFALASRGVS